MAKYQSDWDVYDFDYRGDISPGPAAIWITRLPIPHGTSGVSLWFPLVAYPVTPHLTAFVVNSQPVRQRLRYAGATKLQDENTPCLAATPSELMSHRAGI